MSERDVHAWLAAWDPDTEDLPDDVARALDRDPVLRARFDARFAPTDLSGLPVPEGLGTRMLKGRRPISPGWLLAAVAVLAVTTGLGTLVLSPFSSHEPATLGFNAPRDVAAGPAPEAPRSVALRQPVGAAMAPASGRFALNLADMPPPPRRVPHRSTKYVQPPPGGPLQYIAVQSSRTGECGAALDAVQEGMRESIDHAALFRGAWLCFSERHQRALERGGLELREVLRHLEGPPSARLTAPASQELPPWARPAPDGLERRLHEFEWSSPFQEVVLDMFGEGRVSDALYRDLYMEGSLGRTLAAQPELAGPDAIARRLFILHQALGGDIGRLLEKHRKSDKRLLWSLYDETAALAPELARTVASTAPRLSLPMPQMVERFEVPGDRPVEVEIRPRPAPIRVLPFTATNDRSHSTFGVDVDTAAYSLARGALLDRNVRPREASVRIEELINAIPYDLPPPSSTPFAVHTEVSTAPWNEEDLVLRVGIQAQRIPRTERKPLHLTFLVDTSCSMTGSLELARTALTELVGELTPADTVALVTFGAEVTDLLAPTSGAERRAISAAIGRMATEGSTRLDAGLRRAYAVASRHADPGAENRVVLLTDGGANVGATDVEGLLPLIRGHADEGITLTTLAFAGDHRDALLESLTDQADGNHHYVGDFDDVRRVLVDGMLGHFMLVARDVKVQVAFDPAAVESWRQIGYTNRAMAAQDFRNDARDGGEVGSGHQVTALYVLRGVQRDHLGALALRWEPPGPQGQGREMSVALERGRQTSWRRSSADHRIALTAAVLGGRLRREEWASELRSPVWFELAEDAVRIEHPIDEELLAMVKRAAQLGR